MAIVEADIDSRGFGRLIIDGEDVSNKVSAFTVKARVGSRTTIELELAPGVVIYTGQAEILPEPRVCKNCGKIFIPTNRKGRTQNFCPPPEGAKRSRCQNTYAQRMFKERGNRLHESNDVGC